MGRKKVRYSLKEMTDALVRSRGLFEGAARILGCSRSTVASHVKRHTTLSELVQQLRESMVDEAEGKLQQALEKGEQWAVKTVLTNLGKTRGYGGGDELAGGVKILVDLREVKSKGGDS